MLSECEAHRYISGLIKREAVMKLMNILLLLFCFLTFNTYAQNLLVGTLANDPPFEYKDGLNNLSGFDIDLMNGICKTAGLSCTFKTMDFHTLFGALDKGEIDLAIAAIVITPERKEHFLFSLPYKFNNQQFVTLKSYNLESASQLYGKRIGIYRDSPEELTVYKRFQGNVQIKLYDNVNDMVYALKHKKVDAIVLEYHRAIYWISGINDFEMLSDRFRSGEGYGIVAKLGNDALIQKVNQALEQMEIDGSYLRIYQCYF